MGLTRLRPAPVGFSVVLEDEKARRAVKVRITQVVHGDAARTMLLEADTEYWPLLASSEYLLTYIETQILRTPGDEQKGMDEFVFDLVSAAGLKFQFPRPLLATPPPPVFLGVGYPGVTIEGWVLWEVPRGTRGLLLRLGPYAFDASAAWFSTGVPGQMRALVTSVADGDTFKVTLPDGSSETVQLVSIQAPDVNGADEYFQQKRPPSGDLACVNQWSQNAAEYAREKLDGQRVMLEFDPLTGDRDASGSLLAYVLTDDGDFGASLVEQGYARALLMGRGGNREADYLLLQGQAQQAGSGLWQCP